MRQARDSAFTSADQISHLIRLSELLEKMRFPDISIAFLRRAQVRAHNLFKLPWREAAPPDHHDDQVDSDQWVVNKALSLCRR